MQLEKAQFITDAPADFEAVSKAFDDYDKDRRVYQFRYYDPNLTWRKDAPLQAAHLRALVGTGQLNETFQLYKRWNRDFDKPIKEKWYARTGRGIGFGYGRRF